MKDQKTPEEILDSHSHTKLQDILGNKVHARNEVLEAMQEYAQTISEGKDREIETLKSLLQETARGLSAVVVANNDVKADKELLMLYQKILAALNKVH